MSNGHIESGSIVLVLETQDQDQDLSEYRYRLAVMRFKCEKLKKCNFYVYNGGVKGVFLVKIEF